MKHSTHHRLTGAGMLALMALSCLGVTAVWAEGISMQGKQPMLEQKKPLPQQMMQQPQQLLAPPTLTRVVPTAYGYDLIGTGFGADKSKLQVFEGFAPLAATAVVSISNDKIAVQSKPSGNIQHKVVVAGQASSLSFTHVAAQDMNKAKAEEDAKKKAAEIKAAEEAAVKLKTEAAAKSVAMEDDIKKKAAMTKPLADTKDASKAAISDANLKQNIDLKGLTSQDRSGQQGSGKGGGQNPGGGQLSGSKGGSQDPDGGGQGGKGMLAGEGMGSGKGMLGGSSGAKNAQQKLKDSLGENVVKGSDADTFGGERVNRRSGKSGTDSRNFTGGGKGNTSSGDDGLDDKAMGGQKGSPEETRYEQQAGAHYEKTENMSKSERQSYWQKEEKTQREGRPNPNDMGTTRGGPMTREEALTQKRGIDAKTGGAGGKGDGRGDQQASGGDGRMILRDKAGGSDDGRGDRDKKTTGTINLDKALEINQVVNPGAQ